MQPTGVPGAAPIESEAESVHTVLPTALVECYIFESLYAGRGTVWVAVVEILCRYVCLFSITPTLILHPSEPAQSLVHLLLIYFVTTTCIKCPSLFLVSMQTDHIAYINHPCL